MKGSNGMIMCAHRMSISFARKGKIRVWLFEA